MKEVRTPHPRWHTCIFLSEGSVGHRRSEEVLLGAERVQVQVVEMWRGDNCDQKRGRRA